jgi:hypothetical protein
MNFVGTYVSGFSHYVTVLEKKIPHQWPDPVWPKIAITNESRPTKLYAEQSFILYMAQLLTLHMALHK